MCICGFEKDLSAQAYRVIVPVVKINRSIQEVDADRAEFEFEFDGIMMGIENVK